MTKPRQSLDTDVDECLRLDVCREGRCINTVGAFRCEYCDSGYRMTRRGHCEGKCARETACHRTGRCGVDPHPGLAGSCSGSYCSVGDPVRPRSLLTARRLFPCPQPLCDFHGSVCLIFYLDTLIISPAGICLSWCLELRTQLIADYSGMRPDLITMSGCSPICKYGAGVTWAYFSFSLFPFGCIPLS